MIHNMDCREGLKQLKDESINCLITSPPYWGLRDYGLKPSVWDDGSKFQLGLEPTFQLYIQHLMEIFTEVKRVLTNDGTCWVNLGDSYSGSGKGIGTDRDTCKEIYTDKDTARTNWKETGVTAKSLCQIPSRFAIAMTDAGWILRNEIIWHKPNCMPCSVKDRFTVDFEKVLFFTKSKQYWFEQQTEIAITPMDTKSRCGFGSASGKCNTNFLSKSNEVGKTWEKTETRNKRCVWTIPTQPLSEAHFAVFPETLIEPMIAAGCPKGGTVCDPFSGSGTTMKVSLRMGRKFKGYEMNPEYIDISDRRTLNERTQTQMDI